MGCSRIFLVLLMLTGVFSEYCDVSNLCYSCEGSDFNIVSGYVCDGALDCVFGDDELGCTLDFECSTGDLMTSRWQCDGVLDCFYGEDEVNCSHCDNVFYHECPSSGVCLHKHLFVCDGIANCGDGSDEENCDDNFHCSSGENLTQWSVCDGYMDCLSGEDEMNCDHCNDTVQFHECPSSKLCLHKSHYLCDGYAQCEDSSDERTCGCDESHQFECDDGTCILDDLLCDGEKDCPSGEDEVGCGQSCGDDQFTCLDHQRCVSVTVRCNGYRDCYDASDEWDCVSLAPLTSALLVLYQGANIPVCSSHWNDDWNHIACMGMGYGTAVSSGTIEISSVSQYAAKGFVLPNREDSQTTETFMELFTFGDVCHDEVITLTCAYDACGSRSQNMPDVDRRKIVHGNDAEEGNWPWQVSLKYAGSPGCGGSLISSQWVLTAAHCVDDDLEPENYSVRLGSSLSYGSDDDLLTIGVTAIVMHQNYDPPTNANDLALLQLSQAVHFNDYIRPVCLASEQETFDPLEFVECYSTGWGALNKEATAHPLNLQELKMTLVDESICQDVLQDLNYDGEIMLCAGYNELFASTCSGDSGGPLVCRSSYTNTWTQAGVTSWGAGYRKFKIRCSGYSVTARMSHYQSWIESFNTGASFTPIRRRLSGGPLVTSTGMIPTDDGNDQNDQNASTFSSPSGLLTVSLLICCLCWINV